MKKALSSLPGVTSVETDADTTTATLIVVPGEFDAASAVAAVKDADYPATKIEDISPASNEAENTTEETTSEESAEKESTETESSEAESTGDEAEATEKAEAKEETEEVVE